MIAVEIIGQVVAAGGQIAADGTDLVLTADHPLPADLLDRLKAHKPKILATLARHDDAEVLREHFEERAGILEYDASLPRPEAELEAAKMTATLSRNRGYGWASLRAALGCETQRCWGDGPGRG